MITHEIASRGALQRVSVGSPRFVMPRRSHFRQPHGSVASRRDGQSVDYLKETLTLPHSVLCLLQGENQPCCPN
jgi:hypothetical protein